MNVAVFGSGSWATAIVSILCQKHDKVFWWVREKEVMEGVSSHGHNPLFLSSCSLPKEKIIASTDINTIIQQGDLLFFVIPAAFLEISLEGVSPQQFENKRIISAIKGIVPKENELVAQFFRRKYNIAYDRQGVVSGPSHAEEVAMERLTYLTCASEDAAFAKEIADTISCRFVHTVLSDDIEGIEYGGVMKNIYALAAGIAFGLGYGDNFISVLIANALQEMERFVMELEPRPRDIKRLAYLGDLLVTAYSQHSRNRRFGQMIGKGYSVESAKMEMKMVAEGYYSADSIHKTNLKHGVQLPIAEAVYNILYKAANPSEEFLKLSQSLL